MAVFLPLAALVFALTVLVLKACPAIRVNGWGFLTGSEWTEGSSYGATVHTDGVAHPKAPPTVRGRSSRARSRPR